MGLLTPLTFAWHCLSTLVAFTSGAYFFHDGRWWQWIYEFYTAILKTFLEAHNQNVSGKWQQAITLFFHFPSPFPGCCNSAYSFAILNAVFPQTRDLLVSQKIMQRHFFSTLHPDATATKCFAVFQLPVTVWSYSEIDGSDASCNFFHERLERAFTHAETPNSKCSQA